MLLALFVAVRLVLLIACANGEPAVGEGGDATERDGDSRRDGRWLRAASQEMLTESLLLSLLGGVAGLLLAVLGVKALVG